MKKLKILVFDDNEIHRAAAKAQLKDHDLTVVGTYDEAQELLTPQLDYEKVKATLKSQFGDFSPYPYRPEDGAKRAEYFASEKVAGEQATTYPDFDVVLSDLLVPPPASRQAQSLMKPVDKKNLPVGIFIGLLAAVKARVKYVAVFTDSDNHHHSHPAFACFDAFNKGRNNPTAFTVEGSKVLLSNAILWFGQFGPEDLSKALEYKEHSKRSDTVRAKNWVVLLEYLLTA